MDVRLHDTPAEVQRFTAALARCFDVVSDSGDYPDRGASVKVRRYLDLRIRTALDDEKDTSR